jgi:hypothetical protein
VKREAPHIKPNLNAIPNIAARKAAGKWKDNISPSE